MRRQLLSGLLVLVAFTVLTGIVYPLVVTGISQVVFPGRADGSLVRDGDRIIGSRLIGQPFSEPRYFHPRPSAAGDGYDGTASGASNLGPSSEDLAAAVQERAAAYRGLNGLAPTDPVPIDAVTASASGLDPHISPENARAQAPRVATARGLPTDRVLQLVADHSDGRRLGVLGEATVNVLELNLALDRQG